jgi:hypothetical protein
MNPFKDVYRTYSLLHRMFDCSHCGARIGEKCIGTSGKRMEACHLTRKQKCAEFRKENPGAYRALRDEVAKNLISSQAESL